ncbi:MAG: V-type ATP synthase subunit C [Euryarchaeota archaeon]|nr:V-type ATP synthase subunit C [Euryarchaeota archaeon]
MSQNSSGPAPYIYTCTRLRVRKSKLLTPAEYYRMLNMGLSEITRFIGETEYQKEVEELATSFKGVDLIEIALSWNLAKEYQRIIDMTHGPLKQFTKTYLERWDIYNVLTILRGKTQGFSEGKIKEVLIPAGSLNRTMLDRLLTEESVERIVESLKGWHLYSVLQADIATALSSGSFSEMENDLYKTFYADLLQSDKKGITGALQFVKFIKLEIDTLNIKTIFRMQADAVSKASKDLFIPGASLTLDELEQISGLSNTDEIIDALSAKIRNEPLLEALDGLREKKTLNEINIDLTKAQLDQMERLSRIHPFSIHPVLVYLVKKKYEVANLRAIARGKESQLPGDVIERYLVI